MNVTNDQTTVRIDRSLLASRERVFEALTSSHALLKWWWPWQPSAEVDARPGGAYRLTTVHPHAGSMGLHGVYHEVVPPERLVYTWCWDGEEPGRATLVTIELASRGRETDLSLRHSGFPTESARDDHVRGWTDCLDRLAVHLDARRQSYLTALGRQETWEEPKGRAEAAGAVAPDFAV